MEYPSPRYTAIYAKSANRNDGVAAVIPVKTLSAAKQRLSPVLTPLEREQFSLKMLESLLQAVLGCEAAE